VTHDEFPELNEPRSFLFYSNKSLASCKVRGKREEIIKNLFKQQDHLKSKNKQIECFKHHIQDFTSNMERVVSGKFEIIKIKGQILVMKDKLLKAIE